jgi:hypothetical protein
VLTVVAALAHALLTGIVVGLCLVGDAVLMRHELTPRLLAVLGLFAAGAAVGALLARPVAEMLARGRPPSARLAAMLAAQMVGTAGFAAFFFFLQTRAYYAPYYPAEPTLEWLYHFAYTGAAAAYQVGVLGLRYFLPLGLIPLFVAAFLFARPRRRL